MSVEKDLSKALARKPAPDGLVERVLSRAEAEQVRRTPRVARMAAAAAIKGAIADVRKI